MNQNLVKALFRLNVLDKVSISTRQNGTVVPIVNGVGYVNMFGSEHWMKELLTKLFPQFPGTFIDVGANVGQTLIKVQSVFPGVDYLGFEPNPVCVAYLAQLIKNNGYKNCRIVPVGLAGKTQLFPLQFYSNASTDAAASIVEDFRSGTVVRTEYVPCFQWKDLGIAVDRVGIIKIDVEGGELEVIEGLSGLIKKDRPAVLMEILPDGKLPERINRQRAVELFFRDVNYECMQVVKDEQRLLSLRPVLDIDNYDDENAAEYVFLPK